MAGSETAATIGTGRSRLLRQRIAEELTIARRTGGLSVREVARQVGVSPAQIERALRGEAGALTLDLAARIAPVVGLQLAASLHPNGDPVRDRAHLALLGRFRRRLHPSLDWRTEVPIPITGDLRAGDGVVFGRYGTILVEAETKVSDIQAVERKARLKQRDLGAERLILLVADTPHNRKVLELHPELRARFTIGARRCLAALARGEDPEGIAWSSSERLSGRIPVLASHPPRPERSHRGLVRRFAKPLSGVTCSEGSNPSLSAISGGITCARSSADRASGCGPEGRGFESRRARHFSRFPIGRRPPCVPAPSAVRGRRRAGWRGERAPRSG